MDATFVWRAGPGVPSAESPTSASIRIKPYSSAARLAAYLPQTSNWGRCMSSAALQVVNLQAGYDQTQVLRGVNLHAMPGEAIVLLGRNGSGRRTMLQAISGNTTDTCSGSVRIIGRESLHEISPDIGHLGLHQQPFESHVIPDFTCEENLLLPTSPQHDFGGGLSLTRIYQLCPV